MKLDVLKPWITRRTTELLKMEDDVVVEFIFNQLEEKVRSNRFSRLRRENCCCNSRCRNDLY